MGTDSLIGLAYVPVATIMIAVLTVAVWLMVTRIQRPAPPALSLLVALAFLGYLAQVTGEGGFALGYRITDSFVIPVVSHALWLLLTPVSSYGPQVNWMSVLVFWLPAVSVVGVALIGREVRLSRLVLVGAGMHVCGAVGYALVALAGLSAF